MSEKSDLIQFIDAILSNTLDRLHSFEYPSLTELVNCINKEYSFVNLTSTHQEIEQFKNKGVSAAFIDKTRGGVTGISHHLDEFAISMDVRKQGGSFSPLVQDAALLAATGSKWSLSPWDGEMTSTQNSIGSGWYLFNDGLEKGFIIGQAADVVLQAQDTIWIIPSLKTILYVDLWYSVEKIAEFYGDLVLNLMRRHHSLHLYLNKKERTILVSDWHCEHFGHYVWNVMSAWGAFFEYANLKNVSSIVCSLTARYFGSIRSIFAVEDKIRNEIDCKSFEHIYDIIFDNSAVVSSIKSMHLDDYTCNSIVRYSNTQCHKEFIDRLSSLQSESWPLLLVSLRMDNRCWLDQGEGLVLLVRRLKDRFPAIAVVIHGLSDNVMMGSTSSWMSIEAEKQLAKEVEEALGSSVSVINTVGKSIHEAVLISELCDLYVAPIGSGMALYRWITNKPGVCFSNKFCLDKNNPERWAFGVFDKFRDNIKNSIYLPLEAITDVGGEQHGEVSRANFLVDQDTLYDKVLLCISQLEGEGEARGFKTVQA